MEDIITLGLLILLQAVLGFDNLLYISLESKRAPVEKQAMIRKMGIGIAIVLRIILLFVLMEMIQYFQEELFAINVPDIIVAHINGHSLIVLGGGVFIMYTAIKEILHMMNLGENEHDGKTEPKASAGKIIAWIVVMNLVFSFDSILSAMALSDVFWVMATAIVISGVLMIWLSGAVSSFLQKNRMYEVLGLFVLFVVGIMLLTEGAHLCHLRLFGSEITAMSKTTFYFVITIMVLIDIVQGRYQKKLLKNKSGK
jgi:predicted tellurium resistance membrane protein TerC